MVKKSELREALLQKLREELALLSGAAALARDEATSEESRARSKYDTHSQEAAYLAQGQARLAAEIKTSLQVYSEISFPSLPADAPIEPGALIELESAEQRAWYFLGPRAGGVEFNVEGCNVLVLTAQSPLGGALIGKRAGEIVHTPGRAGATVTHRIASVS
jgi:transcription elongation GreA/GreB family factor